MKLQLTLTITANVTSQKECFYSERANNYQWLRFVGMNLHRTRTITTNVRGSKEWIYTERVQFKPMCQVRKSDFAMNAFKNNISKRINFQWTRSITTNITGQRVGFSVGL